MVVPCTSCISRGRKILPHLDNTVKVTCTWSSRSSCVDGMVLMQALADHVLKEPSSEQKSMANIKLVL